MSKSLQKGTEDPLMAETESFTKYIIAQLKISQEAQLVFNQDTIDVITLFLAEKD